MLNDASPTLLASRHRPHQAKAFTDVVGLLVSLTYHDRRSSRSDVLCQYRHTQHILWILPTHVCVGQTPTSGRVRTKIKKKKIRSHKQHRKMKKSETSTWKKNIRNGNTQKWKMKNKNQDTTSLSAFKGMYTNPRTTSHPYRAQTTDAPTIFWM